MISLNKTKPWKKFKAFSSLLVVPDCHDPPPPLWSCIIMLAWAYSTDVSEVLCCSKDYPLSVALALHVTVKSLGWCWA